MPTSLLLHEPPPAPDRSVRRAALTDLDRPETYPMLSDTAVQLTALADREDVSVARRRPRGAVREVR